MATGYGVGKADSYAADLSAELGWKLSGQATTAMLVDLISQVEAARAGKPVKAPVEPPKVTLEVEGDEEEEDEEEEDDEKTPAKKSSPTASKPKSKKKKR
jgi:hypothetical protein